MSNPFEAELRTFYTTVQQQIEDGEGFPLDPIGQEDCMYDGVNRLYDQGVITNTEAFNIYSDWITRRRPDTTIIRVQPKPRGYGRGYHNE